MIKEVTKDCHSLVYDIYKKTAAYQLEKTKINDDGSLTRFHSDKWEDEHPNENPIIETIKSN